MTGLPRSDGEMTVIAMAHRQDGPRGGTGEAGFALILAIMALMILTFLGLTLATSTSTELQIATNYRWSQQALYNAEAGLELGKKFLLEAEWRTILPLARGSSCTTGPCTPMLTPPGWSRARPDPGGNPSRNFENKECDTMGHQGLGVVLDNPNFAFPFQNMTAFLNQGIRGSFTIWIRRPFKYLSDGTQVDETRDDRLVLTSEGTAPFSGASATAAFARPNRAVRYLEITIQKSGGPGGGECLQAGCSGEGDGYDAGRVL